MKQNELRYYKIIQNGDIWYYCSTPSNMKRFWNPKYDVDILRISEAEYKNLHIKMFGYAINFTSRKSNRS